MPKINEMLTSKYLKKADATEPRLVTFRAFKRENVAKDNEPAEFKWVAYFDGLEKGLVLNKTNLTRAARALGSDNTDDWIGKSVVLFYDDSIEFGGEIVGGLRLRAVKPSAGASQARAQVGRAQPSDDLDNDEIPF